GCPASLWGGGWAGVSVWWGWGVWSSRGSVALRVMRVAGRTGHLDDAAVLVLCHEGPAPGGGRP
ncbi:hypothetical protein ACFW0U_30930, partial [Streptomyces albidoflavus]